MILCMYETIKTQNSSQMNHLKFFEPPGGFLVWLIVVMELLVFIAGFIFVALMRKNNPEMFFKEQAHFNLSTGIGMTLVLLTSGWLVAEAVHAYFQNNKKRATLYQVGSAILGVVFLVIKYFDFQNKSQLGLSLGKNDFWDTYWLLTGFHYAHVCIGVVLLGVVSLKLVKKSPFEDEDFAIRGSAVFWHMCDLAWFFLFPLFYVKVTL